MRWSSTSNLAATGILSNKSQRSVRTWNTTCLPNSLDNPGCPCCLSLSSANMLGWSPGTTEDVPHPHALISSNILIFLPDSFGDLLTRIAFTVDMTQLFLTLLLRKRDFSPAPFATSSKSQLGTLVSYALPSIPDTQRTRYTSPNLQGRRITLS